MSEGYVKLHRQLLEWEWFADSATVHVLTYLMITANWKEAKWMGITIPPGGTVTSREKIAAHTGLSEKQVRLALDKLEKGRVIERDRAGKGQLVTLVNWAKYQGDEHEQGRQRASHRADGGPTKGQQSGRKRAAIEEGQEGETGKQDKKLHSNTPMSPKGEGLVLELEVEQVEHLQAEEIPFASLEFSRALDQWIQHRKEIRKPMKQTAREQFLKKCQEMGEQRAIAAIEHSVANGYQGLFEPNTNRTNGSQQQTAADKATAALDLLLARQL